MATSSIPGIITARRGNAAALAKWNSPLAALPPDIETILRCAAGDDEVLAA
ncbi:MAG: hypothetical protein JSR18_03060, partial [Proteobacteria bacterium]|nr:hypothetical protein [Pseudomonadota bacterium]